MVELSSVQSLSVLSLSVKNIQQIKMNFMHYFAQLFAGHLSIHCKNWKFLFSPVMFHLSHCSFKEAGEDVSDTENERQNKEK